MLERLFELIIDRNKSIIIDEEEIKFSAIKEISIDEGINEHSTLLFKGELLEKENFLVGQNINIISRTNTNDLLASFRQDILFTGFIEKVELIENHISIEAKSYSILLDREKKNRSFQDVKKKYKDIFEVVEKEGKYEKLQFMFNNKLDKALDKLIVQYEETDWEFLKRMASHFNQGVVVENGCSLTGEMRPSYKTKKIFFGFIEEGSRELEGVNYIIKGKDKIKGNYLLVSSRRKYELTNIINYENRKYLVTQVKISYVNSVITYEYLLEEENNLYFPKIINQNINGKSILAQVKEVGTGENLTRVKVDFIFENRTIGKEKEMKELVLETEEKNNSRIAWEKYWFKFATPYSSQNGGIYIMPEPKDRLLINFISEDNFYAGESIREENKLQEKHPEPSHKRIKISTGQQVMLSKELEKVMIIGNDERTVFADVVKDHIKFVADESEAVLQKDNITVKNCDNTVHMNDNGMLLQTGDSIVSLTKDGINLKIGDASIILNKNKVQIKCGNSGFVVENGKVDIKK